MRWKLQLPRLIALATRCVLICIQFYSKYIKHKHRPRKKELCLTYIVRWRSWNIWKFVRNTWIAYIILVSPNTETNSSKCGNIIYWTKWNCFVIKIVYLFTQHDFIGTYSINIATMYNKSHILGRFPMQENIPFMAM